VALLLDETSVAQLLTPRVALEGVELAFRLLAEGVAVNEPRRRTSADGTTLNVMWALAPTLDALAVKSYPVVRSDVSQAAVILVTLYRHSTGECLGVVQGDLLGQRRTAAATALAIRTAARQESRTMAVFGTGYQAAGQVEAAVEVLPGLREVNVVGRTPQRRDAFIDRLSVRFPELHVTAVDAETAVRSADVVITATGATEPVFDGTWLKPGTHVNAIGSNQARSREIDLVTLDRSAAVIVDSRDVAALEGGDLLANGFAVERAVELGEVLVGQAAGRRTQDDITVFDSHGLALQDLVCGVHVLQDAERQGLGRSVDWPHSPGQD
jgi:ornithine cyclodeaminase/alanine dehydrogenase